MHLTVAMATGRSPIKVPCENEDLPEKENAPDSQGELGSTSASVIVKKIYIPSVQECEQMWRMMYTLYNHFK